MAARPFAMVTGGPLTRRALTRSCSIDNNEFGVSDWWAAVLALGGLACSSNADRGRPRYCRRHSARRL